MFTLLFVHIEHTLNCDFFAIKCSFEDLSKSTSSNLALPNHLIKFNNLPLPSAQTKQKPTKKKKKQKPNLHRIIQIVQQEASDSLMFVQTLHLVSKTNQVPIFLPFCLGLFSCKGKLLGKRRRSSRSSLIDGRLRWSSGCVGSLRL